MTTNNAVAAICNSHAEAEVAVKKLRHAGRVYIMKHQRTSLLIALLVSLVVARPSRAGPSASTALPTEKQKIHWFTPTRTAQARNDLGLVEGLSPRAWTTTVGWHPGASVFPDAETCGPRMCLFWVGHEPWLHVLSPIDH